MSEEDWANALLVFRACLPRRGRKAADDRRFLEALHFFTVENVRWRALPKEYGPWNSVWKRFDRLSKAGVFEAFFDTLAAMRPSAHLIQMLDSTIVRAHVSAASAKGGKAVILPYSARARPGAPVAVPIDWEELADTKDAHPFTIDDADELWKRVKGLKGWSFTAQSLQKI